MVGLKSAAAANVPDPQVVGLSGVFLNIPSGRNSWLQACNTMILMFLLPPLLWLNVRCPPWARVFGYNVPSYGILGNVKSSEVEPCWRNWVTLGNPAPVFIQFPGYGGMRPATSHSCGGHAFPVMDCLLSNSEPQQILPP